MKIKGKKAIVIAIVFALILALSLGACTGSGTGTGGDANAGNDTANSSANDASAAADDEILIGYVTAFTGPLSVFTVATKWVDDKCLDVINNQNGGIKVGDKTYKLRVLYGDTQSDPAKATEVATKMVTDDKVNILVGAWTPDNTAPVSAVGERYKIPTYISNSPAESWINSGGPYTWAMGTLFYMKDLETDNIGSLKKLDTNKKVGFVFDSEVDGMTIAPMLQPMLEEEGFTVFDPGRFPKATTDYTDIIRKLQAEDCDIVVANMIGPDFQVLWKQFHEAGYVPKAFNIGKAVHFQADADALGEGLANGLMSEVLWDRSFPYTSPLLNVSCDEISQEWEDTQGTQFPATLGYDISLWEVLSDALSRANSLDPADIRDAILATDIDSIYGHLKFDENQVAKVPCVTVQWLTGDTWSYEKTIVSTVTIPEIPAKDPIIIPDTTQK